jgi:hypothetical protein
MLIWDEIEVMACLEVLPEKDTEYQTWYRFTVTQAGLTLVLTLTPAMSAFVCTVNSCPSRFWNLFYTIAPRCVMSKSQPVIGAIISNLPPPLAAALIHLAGTISYCYGVSA